MAGICSLTGTERARARGDPDSGEAAPDADADADADADVGVGLAVSLVRAVVAWLPQPTSSEAIAAVAKARLEGAVIPRSPAGGAR
jgi:hypothetical protein